MLGERFATQRPALSLWSCGWRWFARADLGLASFGGPTVAGSLLRSCGGCAVCGHFGAARVSPGCIIILMLLYPSEGVFCCSVVSLISFHKKKDYWDY